jgi:DNA-binding response OmpR family regulator
MGSNPPMSEGCVRPASILIVDDDVDMAALLRDTLHREGFQTSVELTGRGALAAVTRHVFDLIIVDKELPDVSGLDLLREFRSRLADVRLMLLTGFGGALVSRAARKRGADRYLDKPVRLDDLVGAVRAVLAESRPGS